MKFPVQFNKFYREFIDIRFFKIQILLLVTIFYASNTKTKGFVLITTI